MFKWILNSLAADNNAGQYSKSTWIRPLKYPPFSQMHHSIIVRCPLIRLLEYLSIWWQDSEQWHIESRPHMAPGWPTDTTDSFQPWAVSGNYSWHSPLYCVDVMHRHNADGYISCFGEIFILYASLSTEYFPLSSQDKDICYKYI